MNGIRLGQLLIESDVLTTRQVDAIIVEQERTGEPFGLLAERLFGVDPRKIEDAWARQYAGLTRTVKPEVEVFDDQAVTLGGSICSPTFQPARPLSPQIRLLYTWERTFMWPCRTSAFDPQPTSRDYATFRPVWARFSVSALVC